MKYYPEGTKVYVASQDCQHGQRYVHLGDYLITNKVPDEPLKFYCDVADFAPHPQATVIEDVTWTDEDHLLARVHDANEAIKTAQAKEDAARADSWKLGEARTELGQAELALRKFREEMDAKSGVVRK